LSSLKELSAARELTINLTLRELRGKYKRSVLGWTWSLLNPLATMLIFSVVFGVFLQVSPDIGRPSGLHNFAFFLLCALLPWNLLANGIGGAMGVLIGNSNLIKKTYFPREVLVAANVASWVVSLLIELAVLAVALIVAGNFTLPWLVPVLFLVIVQTVFVLGIALTLSVLNVYFRDAQHLVGILLQIWFYSTPIVYPIGIVQRELANRPALFTLYRLNPMVRMVSVYRNLLYDLRLPPFTDVAYLVVVAGLSLGLGLYTFGRFEPKLAEEL
jgi:lipopolysaccharide transport system permease protein